MSSVQSLLMEALKAQQQGDLPHAEAKCREVLALDEKNPDALQFLGMLRWRSGFIDEGEALMRNSLEIYPRQAHVWANLGNLLRSKMADAAAIKCYEESVSIDPKFVNGHYNLGLALSSENRFQEAVKHLEIALQLAPQAPSVRAALSYAYQGIGNLEKADQILADARAMAPNDPSVWAAIGGLKTELSDFPAAVEAYKTARANGLDIPDIYLKLASAYDHAGQSDRAVETFNDAIQKFPTDGTLQTARAKFLWESGTADDHLKDLRKTISAYPGHISLWGSYFDLLSYQGRFHDILEKMETAISQCGNVPRLIMADAVAKSCMGKIEEANAGFEKLLELDPDGNEPKLTYSEHLLKTGGYSKADVLCAQVLKQMPYDQRALALQGLAWRILNDDRYHWLLDYEKMVRPVEIPLPKGFSSTEEYFAAIKVELEKLHTTQAHPLDQTLRGGTQTDGFLFSLKNPLIEQLGTQIKLAVESVLPDFPRDVSHPFWGRNTGSVQFKGAWSVRLLSEGFHTNHYHPQGWLSSALYISLPECVATSEAEEGYIQFGEPTKEMGINLKSERTVQPAVGKLVLFPSYMFHGTIPFVSKQPRITVAFDMVPVN